MDIKLLRRKTNEICNWCAAYPGTLCDTSDGHPHWQDEGHRNATAADKVAGYLAATGNVADQPKETPSRDPKDQEIERLNGLVGHLSTLADERDTRIRFLENDLKAHRNNLCRCSSCRK